MSIKWNTVTYVAPWMLERYPGGKLFDGALLIKVKGPNQLATYVEAAPFDALVSGTFVMAGVQGVDPWYLTSYLTQEYAQAWRTRLRQNITVEFTPYDELAEIPVIAPSADAQRAIGNKLRKAERLRELCAFHWKCAIESFERESGISLNSPSYKYVDARNISTSEFHCVNVDPPVSWANPSDSIAAQYFHPRRVHAQQIAGAQLHWDALGKVATSKRRKERNVTPAHCIGLDQIDSLLGVITTDGTGSDQDQPSGIVYRKSDILFSRLRPYLNKVAIWPEHWGLGTGSGELLVYEAGNSIEAYYLFFILKSPLGLYQVMDVTAGSTLPRVDSDVIEEIRIPRLQGEVERLIARLVQDAHRAWYQSQELIPRAAGNVAALLDGNLDDAKLLAEGEEIEEWLKQNPSPTGRRS